MAYLDRLLATDEHIVFSTRQHWIVLVGALLRHVIVTIALLVGFDVLATGFTSIAAATDTLRTVQPSLTSMEQQLRLLLPTLEIVIITGGSVLLLWTFVVWQSVHCVVTSRRVVHVRGVFNKRTLDSSLDMINDIGLTQSWVGRLADYGNIEIMTASEEGTNLLPALAQPLRFKQALAAARRAYRHSGNGSAEQRDERPQAAVVYTYLDCLLRWTVLTEADFRQLMERVTQRTHADGTLHPTPRTTPTSIEPQ